LGKLHNNNKVNVNIAKSLKCLLINARSIVNVNKLGELELLATTNGLDVLAVTESWATSNISNSELQIDGYAIYRKDRSEVSAKRGGGVLLYVKLDYVSFENEKLNVIPCESLWVKIATGLNSYINFGVCYRSQLAPEDEVNLMFSAIKESAKVQSIIVGDFNYPNIVWDTFECKSKKDEMFIDLVQECFLTQHVDEPTRGRNILDLVFTTEPNMVKNLLVSEHLSTSDHQIIQWDLEVETLMRDHTKHNFSYDKANYEGIKDELAKQQWRQIFENKSTEVMWNCFKNIINDLITKYVPVRKVYRNRRCQWADFNAKKILRYRNKKWKKYKISGSESDFLLYKQARNKATTAMRKARYKFEKKLASKIKSDSKTFFKYVRSKSKTKDVVGPLKKNDGTVVNNETEIGEMLNEYFSSTFTVEDDKCPDVARKFIEGEDSELKDFVIEEEQVKAKISKLKDDKAPGDDGFVPKFLKNIVDEITEPLTLIFNKSLKESFVPLDWKLANVTPIFKKGSRQLPANYRPVSLTSHIGKLLESLLRDKMITHLNSYKLIGHSQHGFTARKSCLTNLLVYLEYVTTQTDLGYPVDVIYLDFQKAFDKVPHVRLVNKIKAHGISGNVLKWIEKWLYDRKQRVVVSGQPSSWSSVLSGVPQGSILGPLLFIIFINDIDDGVISKLLKFADDTKVFAKVSTQQDIDRLQNDLHKLFNWSVDWQMLFNADKSKVIHFGFNNRHEDYYLQSNKLCDVKEERDLGVMIHNSLKSSKQCVKAANAANATLGMIKRTFMCKDKDIILKLYKSVVRPKLEFCVQAWSPHLQKDIDTLEKVQRRATKIISGLSNKSYYERLELLGLTTLKTRRIRADLIETFKILNGFDNICSDLFFERSESGLRGHSMKLVKKNVRLDVRKYFFSNRVINEWNNLTEDIIQCETINNFKNKIDRHLKYTRGFI
jgi:ribonuclease P/MRP protein subunit RPP40